MRPPNILEEEIPVGKRFYSRFVPKCDRLVARQFTPSLPDIAKSASDGFMVVERKRLFEQARDRWPPRMRVYPTNGFPAFDAEPSLVDVHRDIQAACDPKGEWTEEDEWTGLANWSFHQALWAVAEQTTSERYIDRDEVTFEMFDERMRSNLSAAHWVVERGQYEESPLRFH